ncbi:hypothetical protein BLNAU_2943 [Blattamonas nauphoetae]|uniref:Uncharacterized protein n=1 Tax=Blattamonas nauphoetae TaxID=2049346 RepID=A0ABQ9YES6_9EUKA|nr:hypothetical protein BLNAU_2943 [Blattamonas nauphoetae]
MSSVPRHRASLRHMKSMDALVPLLSQSSSKPSTNPSPLHIPDLNLTRPPISPHSSQGPNASNSSNIWVTPSFAVPPSPTAPPEVQTGNTKAIRQKKSEQRFNEAKRQKIWSEWLTSWGLAKDLDQNTLDAYENEWADDESSDENSDEESNEQRNDPSFSHFNVPDGSLTRPEFEKTEDQSQQSFSKQTRRERSASFSQLHAAHPKDMVRSSTARFDAYQTKQPQVHQPSSKNVKNDVSTIKKHETLSSIGTSDVVTTADSELIQQHPPSGRPRPSQKFQKAREAAASISKRPQSTASERGVAHYMKDTVSLSIKRKGKHECQFVYPFTPATLLTAEQIEKQSLQSSLASAHTTRTRSKSPSKPHIAESCLPFKSRRQFADNTLDVPYKSPYSQSELRRSDSRSYAVKSMRASFSGRESVHQETTRSEHSRRSVSASSTSRNRRDRSSSDTYHARPFTARTSVSNPNTKRLPNASNPHSSRPLTSRERRDEEDSARTRSYSAQLGRKGSNDSFDWRKRGWSAGNQKSDQTETKTAGRPRPSTTRSHSKSKRPSSSGRNPPSHSPLPPNSNARMTEAPNSISTVVKTRPKETKVFLLHADGKLERLTQKPDRDPSDLSVSVEKEFDSWIMKKLRNGQKLYRYVKPKKGVDEQIAKSGEERRKYQDSEIDDSVRVVMDRNMNRLDGIICLADSVSKEKGLLLMDILRGQTQASNALGDIGWFGEGVPDATGERENG